LARLAKPTPLTQTFVVDMNLKILKFFNELYNTLMPRLKAKISGLILKQTELIKYLHHFAQLSTTKHIGL
jgi:phage gp16-like protein